MAMKTKEFLVGDIVEVIPEMAGYNSRNYLGIDLIVTDVSFECIRVAVKSSGQPIGQYEPFKFRIVKPRLVCEND